MKRKKVGRRRRRCLCLWNSTSIEAQSPTSEKAKARCFSEEIEGVLWKNFTMFVISVDHLRGPLAKIMQLRGSFLDSFTDVGSQQTRIFCWRPESYGVGICPGWQREKRRGCEGGNAETQRGDVAETERGGAERRTARDAERRGGKRGRAQGICSGLCPGQREAERD